MEEERSRNENFQKQIRERSCSNMANTKTSLSFPFLFGPPIVPLYYDVTEYEYNDLYTYRFDGHRPINLLMKRKIDIGNATSSSTNNSSYIKENPTEKKGRRSTKVISR